MAEFQFRMQSVVQLRERKRDQASQAYQQALLAKEKLQEQIDDLLEQHAAQTPLQTASNMGRVEPQRLLESQRFQLQLMVEVNDLKSKMNLIDLECEKRRLALVETEKDVRCMEKLRERQLAEWHILQAKREQIALDQWSGFRYWDSSQSDPGTS